MPPVPPEKVASNGFPRRNIPSSSGLAKDVLRTASPNGIGPSLLVEGTATTPAKGISSSSPASAREPGQPRDSHGGALSRREEELFSEVERLSKLVIDLKMGNEQLAAQLQEGGDRFDATRSPLSKQDGGTPGRAAPGHINELRAMRHSTDSVSSMDPTQSAAHRRKRPGGADLWDNEQDGDGGSANEQPSEESSLQVHEKTDEQKHRLLAALKQRAPFDSLSEDMQLMLIDAMVPKQANAGEVIIQEGDTNGTHCYLLDAGELTVTVKGETKAKIQKGAIFGEIALFYNMPRTATVTASSDISFFELNRKAFQSKLREETVKGRREVFSFLSTCELFNKMSRRDLSRVADAIQPKSFKEGEVIVQEGDVADGMYFMKEGQVVVKQSLPDDENQQKLIGILKVGEYFGERALLTDDLRSASVEAVTDVVCLCVDKETFLKLLNPLHEDLKSAMPALPSPRGARRPSQIEGSNGGAIGLPLVPRINRYAPRMETLQHAKPLGAGGFARVVMVRDRCTRRLYALKIISKKALVAKNAVVRTASVLHEKHCLEELNHPFVLSLVSSYQDRENLYLLITIAMGGELFRVMEEFDKLTEPMACFYVASLTLALQHIHLMEYVYRDLKPENVMLDQLGFIKVCDFGFAKKVQDRTFTQCGTPDYVAPEMLMGQGVNQACDWWALGILLYEMIAAVPPFTDPDGEDMTTFSNILKGEINYPPPEEASFSDDCKSLIAGLLTPKVSNRLGYLKEGAEDLVGHKWFKGKLDWDSLINLTVKPPWVPELKSADDTCYFDQEAMEECEQMHASRSKGPLSDEDDAKWAHIWQAFDGAPPPIPVKSTSTPAPPEA